MAGIEWEWRNIETVQVGEMFRVTGLGRGGIITAVEEDGDKVTVRLKSGEVTRPRGSQVQVQMMRLI